MAKMIPSTISPEVQSKAEKKIFQWFKDAPGTKNWIVLHSLGIAEHEKNLIGEADFCVLAPGLGVFVLEVKGGRVQRKDGKWFFTNRNGETFVKDRGPFEQAKEGAFSIVDVIKQRLSPDYRHLKKLHFGYGVMFPDIQFNTSSVEYHLWQIFDKSYTNKVADFIRTLSSELKKKKINKDGFFDDKSLPSKRDVQHIKDILRPDFDKKISLDVQVKDTEKRLIELTNEQYQLLDQLEDNPRCLIHGPAGTGKTLLALEEVKRHVREGRRVALFCYNANLADWLKSRFDDADRPSFIGTLNSYMLRCSQEAHLLKEIPEDSKNDPDYYRRILPRIANEAIKTLDDPFDVIIIDEAQDLLYEDNIHFLDNAISKGLYEGRWVFFGDFSRQSIYTDIASYKKVHRQLSEMTHFINFKLKVNCRNTKHIFEEMATITSFDDETTILKVEGVPVQHYTYGSRKIQAQKLRKLLNHLKKQNISPNEITILSPFKLRNSIVADINSSIRTVRIEYQEGITFSTIQAFKGLENSVIILTDIEDIDNKKLMYVGLSRARSALYLLMSDRAHDEYNKLKAERALNNGR